MASPSSTGGRGNERIKAYSERNERRQQGLSVCVVRGDEISHVVVGVGGAVRPTFPPKPYPNPLQLCHFGRQSMEAWRQELT